MLENYNQHSYCNISVQYQLHLTPYQPGRMSRKTFFQLPSVLLKRPFLPAYKYLVSISLLACYQSHNSMCKSQVLENTLSHHIISAVLSLRAFSVDTRSCLCLLFRWFLALGPILVATVPRLAARPWPLLTNRAERRFRISKGEREVEGMRVCVCASEKSVLDRDRRVLYSSPPF